MTVYDVELTLLEDTLRKTMTTRSGADLDTALTELGWHDMLTEMPDLAVPIVFRLLGETGAHGPFLNDVVLDEAGLPVGGAVPCRTPEAPGFCGTAPTRRPHRSTAHWTVNYRWRSSTPEVRSRSLRAAERSVGG